MSTTNPPAVHEWTGPTGVKFRYVREPSGTYYHDTVPRPVINALELLRVTKERVRLFIGDSETGRCWLDEWDVTGTISRSMGPIKIPILIASSRSHGGGAILCDCIIKIIVDGREIYRHQNFQNPKFHAFHEGTYQESPWAVTTQWPEEPEPSVHARFKTQSAATRWIDFMEGRRMAK